MAKAIVAGSGIAGLAASFGLSRAGFEVEMIERNDRVEALGSGITLIGPALRILQEMDLLDRCLKEGRGSTEFRFCNVDGSLMQALPTPRLLGPDFPGILGIMRPSLHGIILDAALQEGVQVRTGVGVVGLEQSDREVDVQLSDGTTERCDLLVGADGTRSTLREVLFGSIPLNFEGQGCFRAVVPRPPEVNAVHVFEGHETVHPGYTPIGEDRMYMFCIMPTSEARLDQAEVPDLMRKYLSDFGGGAAEAREHIEEPVDYRLIHTLILPKPWHDGRVALMGDAVHTPTPQLGAGGALGLEDAVVLVDEIQKADGDIPTGLANYSERRFERANFIVEACRRLSYWQVHPDAPGADRAGLTEKAFARLAEPA